MRVLTLVGTRPELIRLSVIIEKLDVILGPDHIFVYTNQNYDPNLKDVFFKDLNIRKPNYTFSHLYDSFSDFLSKAIVDFELVLKKEKPDKLLVLGDTNSGLLAILAQKHGIPIYHMEAGNRCFDSRVPEETNRKIIDSVSTYNLPYTENSRQNLLSEGFHKNNIYKTGNPIFEVLDKYRNTSIQDSTILKMLDLNSRYMHSKEFVLVTCHRSENVDNQKILKDIESALSLISFTHNVIFSVHPRTKERFKDWFPDGICANIIVSEPFGFFDFVQLERNAKLVITDSGTVQEECAIFKVPCLVIRESTERQELIECGASVLCGTDKNKILSAFDTRINRNNTWNVPEDYTIRNVSDTVINILLGK